MSFVASSHKLARRWGLCGSVQSHRVTSSGGLLPALASPQPPLVPSSARAAPCPPGETVSYFQEEAFTVQQGVKSYCINENKVLGSLCTMEKYAGYFLLVPQKLMRL